ncbi:MAG: hypothetical protein ABJH05_04260 [Fulvivirga sp.]
MKNIITLLLFTFVPASMALSKTLENQNSMGLGMAKPDFYNKSTLYFYSPNLDKSPDDHTSVDSLVFKQTEIGYSISYAPPWFFPVHLKMDYEILYMKVISIRHDWMLVEVNRQTHLTYWIAKNAVTFIDWPSFLLKVNSVEPISSQNTLKQKPLPNASEFTSSQIAFLRPVAVRDQWLQVDVLDNNYKVIAKGIWLRWRNVDQLLITYSLLS